MHIAKDGLATKRCERAECNSPIYEGKKIDKESAVLHLGEQ